MRHMNAIAWKELKGYFTSPLAGLISGVFMAITGVFFQFYITRLSSLSSQPMGGMYQQMKLNINTMLLEPTYHPMVIVFLFVIPFITMGLIAGECRLGTFELISTSPVPIPAFVLGKFLGAMLFLGFILLLTSIYPIISILLGKPEVKPILTTYLGWLLLISSFVSIGLLFSSLFSSEPPAALASFGVLLFIWLLSQAVAATGETSIMGKVLVFLSPVGHYEKFIKGIINLADISYYVTFTAFFLFLTNIKILSLRWR